MVLGAASVANVSLQATPAQLTTNLSTGTVQLTSNSSTVTAGKVLNVVVDDQTLAARVTTADPAASTTGGAGVSSANGAGGSPAPAPSPSSTASSAAASSATAPPAGTVYGVVFGDPTSFLAASGQVQDDAGRRLSAYDQRASELRQRPAATAASTRSS